MIAHLWKLIWNRKRANALILAELVAAFLVLAALATSVSYFVWNARQPLGLSSDGVWVAGVGHGIDRRMGNPPEKVAEAMTVSRQLLQVVRDLPEVEAVTAAATGPFVSGQRNTQTSDGDEIPVLGRGLIYDIDQVTDDFIKVFGLQVVRGRWFGRQDDGQNYWPVVINEKMARDFFGDADPVGQQIGRANGKPARVVGVAAGYRQKGELAPPIRYLFRRYVPGDPEELPYHKLFIKTRPGTTAAFEDALDKRLRVSAPREWHFSTRYLPDVRAANRKVQLLPLIAAAIVAGFLMLMVVLGLTGVLWQNVTQRTREIGLRRAKGASRPYIYAQILGELMVMTTIAVLLGSLLLAHVPFLGLVDDMNGTIYLMGGGGAALLLFMLTAVCGYYPARLAARVQPALALRTE
jgi:putative ABC transport system permease protein